MIKSNAEQIEIARHLDDILTVTMRIAREHKFDQVVAAIMKESCEELNILSSIPFDGEGVSSLNASYFNPLLGMISNAIKEDLNAAIATETLKCFCTPVNNPDVELE